MFQLMHKLNAKLRNSTADRGSAEAQQAQAATRVGRARYWSAAEVGLLLECEQRQTPVTAELPGVRRASQTRLLGLDLIANQLLLERFAPCPPIHLLAEPQPVWLTLPAGDACYRLCVQPRERLTGNKWLVDIVATEVILAEQHLHSAA